MAKTPGEYISQFSEEIQIELNKIRSLVKKTAPDAIEAMGYGVSAFKLNGEYLIYYAAFKKHIGIYPSPTAIEFFKEELKEYNPAKGTIKFPFGTAIPYDLIKRIIEYMVKELS
jgi:uncharacterized protein YdhG (YjbR/CyaY superfamily)